MCVSTAIARYWLAGGTTARLGSADPVALLHALGELRVDEGQRHTGVAQTRAGLGGQTIHELTQDEVLHLVRVVGCRDMDVQGAGISGTIMR